MITSTTTTTTNNNNSNSNSSSKIPSFPPNLKRKRKFNKIIQDVFFYWYFLFIEGDESSAGLGSKKSRIASDNESLFGPTNSPYVFDVEKSFFNDFCFLVNLLHLV